MKVLKFGGTSVGSPERIEEIHSIIAPRLKKGEKLAVIVSAFCGTTDQLLDAAHLAKENNPEYTEIFQAIEKRHLKAVKDLIKQPQKTEQEVKKTLNELKQLLQGINLLGELSLRSLDLVASFGERLSAYIVSQYLNQKFPTEYLDSRKLIVTDDTFTYAKVDFKKTDENIQNHFKKHSKLQLITGFIGATPEKETTTLGRGGSDYSASIFGAALHAEEIEIWTDVNGIMSADPRKAKKAFTLDAITYKEAMEMSHFGAKVIHPPTMQPAMKKHIPIRIKNTMQPDFPGSVINDEGSFFGSAIKGISSINEVALLQLQGSGLIGVTGVSQRLFGSLAKEKINIILISQASSEHSICFAIDPKSAEKAKKAIEEEFKKEIADNFIDPVIVEKELSIIAVVGENMCHVPGTSGKVFQALGSSGINVKAIAQGSSELNISIVISKSQEEKAINVIHDALFMSKIKTLNLFMIGPGLVGKALLKQLQEEQKNLLNNQELELNLVALADRKHMLFAPQGINLKNWPNALEKSGEKSDLKKFLKQMIELNLANSVFIDCTSSEETAATYSEILQASISVVTPNKKAQSSNIKNYLNLASAASKSNAKFLYETNVGAGLPVIKTLQDLQLSGDKLEKIEAVLSGTLSYIFNNVNSKTAFSEIVLQAKEKGYTEPDPRDDLNGLDVARKILILARETGKYLELTDIEVENLVPEDCRATKSVEEFFQKLKTHDETFRKKIQAIEEKGQRLRYIATLENGQASISLKAVDENHPFYNLSGSDNIIAFTTKYYNHCPLVIKGPGAGAEVTAAGVLSDIIRIAGINFNKQLTKFSFLDKLANNKLAISLIGMSNIGKSYWSKKLSGLGFKHICCDDLIEAQLEPELTRLGYKGIADMAKWLGQPYDKQFKTNEKTYLNLEKATMENVLSKPANQNTVIDTTGSVIHTGEKVVSELKRQTLVIYIEASPEMKEAMLKKYLENPKPVVWADTYKQEKNESEMEALKRCYMQLLAKRSKLYEELADIVIPFHTTTKVDQNQFLKLIQEKL